MDRVAPWGDEWERTAMLLAAIESKFRNTTIRPERFIPRDKSLKYQTDEEMEAIFEAGFRDMERQQRRNARPEE